MKIIAGLAALAVMLAAGAAAAQTLAIVNARIATAGPAGVIPSGTVVVRDGRIAAVGADVVAPPGAPVIDAAGRTLTPGLVAVNTTLSVSEVVNVAQTRDFASTTPSISAAFDVRFGVNPDSVLIPEARRGGVTRAVVTPNLTARDDEDESEAGLGRESLFAGQAVVIHLGDGRDLVVKPQAAMVASVGEAAAGIAGGARGAAMVAFRTVLEDARHFRDHRAAFDRAETRAYSLSRADLEALAPVVDGRMPLMVSVSRASDILQVLALGREYGLRIVLEGAEEGWLVAGEIAAASVPVVLNPLSNLPARFETTAASLDNAARLHRAGVRLVIAGDRTGHYARQLRTIAGNAVANGLPRDEALKAVTLNPAVVFGVADRVGSIEVGKEADLVLWTGDPFEPLTRAVTVLVRGRVMPLASRQTALRDRYVEEHFGPRATSSAPDPGAR